MSLTHWLSHVGAKWATLPVYTRVLMLVALSMFVIELVLRYGAPESRAYAAWTKVLKAIGHVWTMVLLAVIYVVAVGPISLAMRATRKDLLDRRLGRDASVWRDHVPNPLGPEAAARHQF